MKTRLLLISILICLTVIAFGQQTNTALTQKSSRNSIPDQIKERKAFKRVEWFNTQRAWPYDTIPVVQYSNEMTREIKKTKSFTSKDRDLMWTSIGPTGISANPEEWGIVSGRVKAIAIHPTDPLTLYIGAAHGGIWKTTDGGQSWQDIGSGLESLAFGAIAIDPNNPETIYAGSGEVSYFLGFIGFDGKGIFKSTDGGNSWTQITNGIGNVTSFGDLAVSPFYPNLLLGALASGNYYSGELPNQGIWKSADAGETWVRTLDVPGAYDIAFHPAESNKVFAAVGGGESNAGFYISTDQGDTWVQSNSGLPAESSMHRLQIDISQSNPEIIYAVIFDANTMSTTAYKSENGGEDWAQISAGTNLGGYAGGWYDQGFYDLCIAVDPENPNLVYIGNVEIHRSENGSSFAPVRPYGINLWGGLAHCDYHKLVFAPSNPNFFYIGCDGGVYKSTDKGYSATSQNEGLSTLQLYRVASHPTNPQIVIGGMQDNSTAMTTDGGQSWSQVTGGDGMECLFNHGNPDIVYTSSQCGTLYRSINGGTSFNYLININGSWTTPLIMHPDNHQILYSANTNILRTITGGSSFHVIASGVSPELVVSLAQSQLNPDNMIFASGGTQNPVPGSVIVVKISTDGGYNWTDVSSNIPGEERWVSRVVTDPADTNTMYVLRTGFSDGNKVWKTTDLGLTWANISGNLPDLPCSDLFIDPENVKHLYLANDIGVYHSGNGGISWEYASEGMPFVPAIDFDHVKIGTDRYLRVGTHGRSIYETILPNYCLAEGITFTTQEEIDHFQTNHPGCTEIEGDVTIGSVNGEDIINLNGLSELTSIGGSLSIYWNLALNSLAGLEGLESVGGNLEIYWNEALINLAGLAGLTSIGGSLQIGHGFGGNGALINLSGLDNLTTIGGDLIILQNWELTSLTGLNNLTSVGGGLSIIGNSALPEIANLNNLTSIGGDINIYENFSLTNLNGLEGLSTVPGNLNLSTTGDFIFVGNPLLTSLSGLANIVIIGGDLKINAQHSLTNLAGLDNLISIGGNLILASNDSLISLDGLENLNNTGGIRLGDLWQEPMGNPMLSNISALENLDAGYISNLSVIYNNILSTCDVKSICDYLSAPNGTVEIHDNAPGCNSTEEVEAACLVAVEEIKTGNSMTIIPNPAKDNITISSPPLNGFTQLSIFNVSGKKVLERQLIANETQIDISTLPRGVYFVRLRNEKMLEVAKMIKNY